MLTCFRYLEIQPFSPRPMHRFLGAFVRCYCCVQNTWEPYRLEHTLSSACQSLAMTSRVISCQNTQHLSHSFSFRHSVSRPVLYTHSFFSLSLSPLALSMGIYSLECARSPVTALLLLCYTSSIIIDVAVLNRCLCFYWVVYQWQQKDCGYKTNTKLSALILSGIYLPFCEWNVS